jgi:outer membrane biosynthesis protein TonB
MDGEQIVHDVAEKVRALITDAETKAAKIVSDAEADAKRIRAEAETESQKRLVEARSAFEELQKKLGLGAEVEPGPVTAPEPEPPAVPEPTPPVPDPGPPSPPVPEPEPPLIPEPTPPPDEGTPPQIAADPAPVAATNGAAPDAAAKSDDTASARLVAMNMALDGASRETIEAHLADNYALADAGSLVDDVLALTSK